MSCYQSRLPEITVYFGLHTSLDNDLVKTPLADHRMALQQHSERQHGEEISKIIPNISIYSNFLLSKEIKEFGIVWKGVKTENMN